MFESSTRLREDVTVMLEALRALGEGRYAAVFDARALVAESSEGGGALGSVLRRLIDQHAATLLRLPLALRDGAEVDDVFAEYSQDEFLLAVVNGRVGVLVACPDAAGLQTASERLLPALVDRLLRLDASWRLDERGRGLFFGSPRLDTVVIPRPAPDA